MSGIVRPKGGAPPSVYWRRRLLLLAVVLLVIAGGFKLFGGNGDDGGGTKPQASTQPSSDNDDESSQQDRSESDKKKQKERRKRNNQNDDATAGQRDVAVNLREKGTCDPAEVTVTPSLAVDSYAGGPVTLRLALSTTADAACELSLSEHEPLVSISDGSDLVWESERCTELIDTASVRLEPNWLSYVDAAWSGRTSRHACGENADFAEPGSYEIKAAVLGGEPTSTSVELAEKPEPKKPDKFDKKDDKQDKQDKKDDKQDEENETQDEENETQDEENETQDDTAAQAD
ncbi:MAG: hypothetical protein L0K86_14325 [Actinomycetia bacterium]|nr:hypothetical protein [Actinomycetes bacterium]